VSSLCPQRWRPLDAGEQESEIKQAQQENNPNHQDGSREKPNHQREWLRERGPPPPPPSDPLAPLLQREDVQSGSLQTVDPDDVLALSDPSAPPIWLPLWKFTDATGSELKPARGEVRVRMRILPPDAELERNAIRRVEMQRLSSEEGATGASAAAGSAVRSSGYGQVQQHASANSGGSKKGNFLRRKSARVKPQKVDWSHVKSRTESRVGGKQDGNAADTPARG